MEFQGPLVESSAECAAVTMCISAFMRSRRADVASQESPPFRFLRSATKGRDIMQ